ncbi:MAG: MFS transporter [Paludibacteraceae bacterium]
MPHSSPWWWVPTLYFAEGVPYFLVTSVSITLFTQLGVPNGEMALFTSLITFPWVLKPLWSPFVDVLRTKRWWVLVMQAVMAAAMLGVALAVAGCAFPKAETTLTVPATVAIALVFFTITAFASATHDIAADGYYMLALSEHQQSAFVGLRSTFYKIANIFCQSALLLIVGWLQRYTTVAASWTYVLLGCSGLLALLAVWHAWAMSPNSEKNTQNTPIAKPSNSAALFKEVGETFVSFFRKPGIALALCFMLVYRLPEALLLKLCNPFFLATQTDGGLGLNVGTVGEIYGIGVVLMLAGGIAGGLIVSRWGLKQTFIPLALWLTLPCIVYVYLAACQPVSFWLIALCIGIEQLGYGLGYTICMVYMMRFADGAHKTAHFSLCTAFMFLGLLLPGLVAGYVEQATGYLGFFWVVMACCIPSIAVAVAVQRKL